MAYDEGVAERIREVFAGHDDVIEKKMFGGIAFMQCGNMCCGVVDDVLMARVGPDAYESALTRPGAREMDFTGRSMKGFVYVDPAGFAEDNQLQDWIILCETFTASLPAK
jgi:TfoX/Sxy family transcriptional regulator of competence genes